MSLHYNREGKTITLDEWATLMSQDEVKRVAYTEVDEGCYVSTVWLGMDHNWTEDGPPIIFETMILGGRYDQEQIRYSTEEQAVVGHARMVEKAAREYHPSS